jgi:phosphonopyruvate decarboxylase
MISVQNLVSLLKKNNCNFYTGVPDSILEELSKILKFKKAKNHILATNEGSAVSIGIGYYLSTKKIPIIYMQNSGLSNAINPLISIAHQNVYSIPLILIIGWRGSPGIKDEPQHNVKGKITKKILDLLKIKYCVIRKTSHLKKFEKLIEVSKKKKSIVACLIEKNTLINKNSRKTKNNFYKLDKIYFLECLLKNITNKTKIFSSTGYNSREIMFLSKKLKLKNIKCFYMVGGMGHTSSTALGYSIFSKKNIVCVDGDGSFLMHLGSSKTIGSFAKKNFKYILINNNSHDSVGGQTTYINQVDLKNYSKSIGFKNYYCIKNKKNLIKTLNVFLKNDRLSFLEVRVSNTKLKNLPRPDNLFNVKKSFIKN